jgi:hypothetical protein
MNWDLCRMALAVGMLCWLAGPALAAHNMLVGGDFEGELARRLWDGNNGSVVEGGHPDGEGHAFVVRNEEPVWRMGQQALIVPDGAAAVRLSGWARTEGVTPPPEGDWRRAKMQIGFMGEDRQLIGSWNDVDLPLGDSPWAFYEGEFAVPDGARRITCSLGLNHVSGTIWLDDVAVVAADAEGVLLEATTDSRTDTSAWYPLDPSVGDGELVADLSGDLDAPAGKHGFLTVREQEFVFEDGTPVRFWGTNVVAGDCFPDHGLAERTAERLARFGCNMVRFHHMDAGWARPNIFSIDGGSLDNTQRLSPESLDRLDYFIAQLEQRGIYVYMDLLVHRSLGEEDLQGIESPEQGAKVVSHFNRRLVDLQKQYAEALLTHHNPYTDLRYVDDPAVAMMDLINESSLFWLSYLQGLPPGYAAELGGLFADWSTSNDRRQPDGTVAELAGRRDPAFLRFLFDTQVAYFREMHDFLRGIGVRVPITGSNHWENRVGNLLTNARMDYIDRHTYWDHPRGGWTPTNATYANDPMVRAAERSNPATMARTRVAGKPFIVTEWNNCWTNEYVTEGPLLMAAYGSLQAWNGLLQFQYSGGDWRPDMSGPFNIGNKPHVMAAYLPSSLVFRRGDVAPGEDVFTIVVPTGDGALADDVPRLVPGALGLVRRLEVSTDGLPADPPAPLDTDGTYVSEGGRLRWNSNAGAFVVDTPRTQGALGFIGGSEQHTADLAVAAATPFCQVLLTSLDGLPIAESHRLLLTATARAENSGQVYDVQRRTLFDAGGPPVLMEPVRAEITIGGARVAVTALSHQGSRTEHELPVAEADGAWRFRIGDEATFWYEVRRQ